jgi:hypothetical protein
VDGVGARRGDRIGDRRNVRSSVTRVARGDGSLTRDRRCGVRRGGVGVESIAHAYARVHGFANWTYVVLAAIEETCEFGVVVAFLHVMETRRASRSSSERLENARMERFS